MSCPGTSGRAHYDAGSKHTFELREAFLYLILKELVALDLNFGLFFDERF